MSKAISFHSVCGLYIIIMCVIIRGALLLYLLYFWTQRSVDAINTGVLSSIIREIRNMARINNHYACAVNLRQEDCNHLGPHDFSDKIENIYNELAKDGGKYVGKRVIAARPLFFQTYTDHAEYRLLGGKNSAMVNLLKNEKSEKSCTVFFTKFSPCGAKCANPNNQFNILQYLDVFKSLDHNWVAFVFQDIFSFELKNNTREYVLGLLYAIHTAGGNLPVYRCSPNFLGQYICVDCIVDPNPLTNKCLDGMPR